MILVLSLSASAKGASTEKEKIVFASSSWPPYVIIDSSGQVSGLYIDLLRELFEKELGYELVHLNVPWKRAQYCIKTGIADFIVTVPNEERLTYAEKSDQPLLEMYLNVFTYADHPKLKDIDLIASGADIKRLGLHPVTNIGNDWHKNEIDRYGVETDYVPAEENSFQMVASKRADITIEPIFAGNYLLKKLNLEDKIVATSAVFGPLNMHLLMSRKSQYSDRMEKINNALSSLIVSGRLQKITELYK